jgi:hypothetical protein
VEKGTKLVLEQVVTTIASVADTSEEQFVAYYDRLMPCLKYIIENATTNELKLLRGKTIECVSLIGLAVGTEKVNFRQQFHLKAPMNFLSLLLMHGQLYTWEILIGRTGY